MLSDPLRTALETAIGRATGAPFAIGRATAASGGCIHSSWVLESGEPRYFAKTNDGPVRRHVRGRSGRARRACRRGHSRAAAGAQGRGGRTARSSSSSTSRSVDGTDADFPRARAQLARLHAHHGGEFGWHRDNFIGLTAQSNTRHACVGRVLAEPSGSRRSSRSPRGTAIAGELQSLGRQLVDAVPRPARGSRARAVAAARRSLGRQRRVLAGRHAGRLRPGGLLRRSRKPISR